MSIHETPDNCVRRWGRGLVKRHLSVSGEIAGNEQAASECIHLYVVTDVKGLFMLFVVNKAVNNFFKKALVDVFGPVEQF